MAYLTPNEGMAAAYATLAFFFVVATGVVSLPQFRHFLSSFDLLLVTVAAALRENTSSRASVAASSLPPVAPRADGPQVDGLDPAGLLLLRRRPGGVDGVQRASGRRRRGPLGHHYVRRRPLPPLRDP